VQIVLEDDEDGDVGVHAGEGVDTREGQGEVRESDEEVIVGFVGAVSEGMMGRSWIAFGGEIFPSRG
jgi:hypothetical protein